MAVTNSVETIGHSTGIDQTDDESASEAAIHVTNEESKFDLEELFFSCTDKRGFITSCNPVFVRVSGYEVHDLIGAPHSTIRHPEMPRAVFKVLWDALKANEPLAAFVKNRAVDGSYYWVLGMALPISKGYLSIRLKPSTNILQSIETAYANVRALEQQLEASGAARTQVLAQSVPALLAELNTLGFDDYESFQRHALPAEISSRRNKLGMTAAPKETADEDHRSSILGDDFDEHEHDIGSDNDHVLTWIARLFDNLDSLVKVNEDLATRSSYLRDLAISIHIFALNAGLSSTMLGSKGRTLEAVTKQLQETSKQIVTTINRATEGVDEAIDQIHRVGFLISIATLESELIGYVATESKDHDDSSLDRQINTLVEALVESVEQVFVLSEDIIETVNHVSQAGTSLFGLMDLLRFELLAGRIEISRLTRRESFNNMFGEIAEQLDAAAPEIKMFGEDIIMAADLIAQFEMGEGHQAVEVISHWLPKSRSAAGAAR